MPMRRSKSEGGAIRQEAKKKLDIGRKHQRTRKYPEVADDDDDSDDIVVGSASSLRISPSESRAFFVDRLTLISRIDQVLPKPIVDPNLAKRAGKIYKAHSTDQNRIQHESVWLSLRAYLAGRRFEDELALVKKKRERFNGLPDDILNFEPSSTTQMNQVEKLLEEVQNMVSLYPSWKYLLQDKPAMGDGDVLRRIEILQSWLILTIQLDSYHAEVTKWVT